MIYIIAYIAAVVAGSILLSLDFGLVVSLGGAFLCGFAVLIGMGMAYRRALISNTLDMIEAEALFHDLRIGDAIEFEAKRARRASLWDRVLPRLSLALPVYVSLITKCLATRRLDEARRWLHKLERYAGERALRLVNHFRLILCSLSADELALERLAGEIRATLDPERPEDRGYLAQLAFVEAKWALRRCDLKAAAERTREGHRLQPELDIYYLLRSQIALASGDLFEAQNYAHSLAHARHKAPMPSSVSALEQLIPVLEQRPERYGEQLGRLKTILEQERARHRAQGMFQQMEVAIYSRDTKLLEESIRELENTHCDHPAAQIRLHAAAALLFAWQSDADHAEALAAEGAALLDHPACADDDLAEGGLWLALAFGETAHRAKAEEILKRAMAVPIFAASAYKRHIRAYIEARLSAQEARRAHDEPALRRAREELRRLAAQPEAELIDALWREAGESYGFDMPERPVEEPTFENAGELSAES